MMKLLVIIIFFVDSAVCHQLQQIQGISNMPYQLEFDSDFNTYIIDINPINITSRLYKLNQNKDIEFTKDLPCPVVNMIVNKRNDVYVFTPKVIIEQNEKRVIGHIRTMRILKSGSTDFKELYTFSMPDVHKHSVPFVDEEDNLYLNTEEGVAMLRPDEEIPVIIGNLETLRIYNDWTSAVDKKGNVYFGLDKINESMSYVAVLDKQAKIEKFPKARYLDDITDRFFHVTELVIDDSDNVWFSTMDGQLKKLSNNVTKTVLLDDFSMYHGLQIASDRLFMFSQSFTDEMKCSVLYVTPDDKVHSIPDLTNLDIDMCVNSKIVSDKEGNIYIAFEEPNDKGYRIATLRKNEEKTKNILLDFSPNDELVLMPDENDDLWILHKNLYIVKKGTETVIPVTELPADGRYFSLKQNEKTRDLFILGGHNVYVYSN